MVLSRKEIQSYLPENLFFLRKQKNKTLEEMAELLSLKGKSSYKAYEDGRALPDIHKVLKLASFFDVGVTDLMYQDIENFKSKKTEEQTLFEVLKVPVKAAAGYARSFGDSTYIKKLETIKIPYKPYGIARAFDISGDSMDPEIPDGVTVIGIKIKSNEIQDNKSYVVVSTEGVQCKKIRVDKKNDIIYLISRNENYPPKHMSTSDVNEIWEVWKILYT
ncbi:MAG TPA: S24 family peptidase [Chitinophagaceae bacterium]|nr:S24 family peptidase [Chitinophagaceae bacterium]